MNINLSMNAYVFATKDLMKELSDKIDKEVTLYIYTSQPYICYKTLPNVYIGL